MPPLLHIQVACAENRVIGREGRLPWSIPEDFKFFQDQTAGQIVLLGRICYESWVRIHEDNRRPVVVTSRPADRLDEGRHSRNGCLPETAATFTEALAKADRISASTGQEIHICGGERVYAETLALTRPMRLHLTLVHADVTGDTHMPEWRHLKWREISRRDSADANFRYTFYTLER